MEKAVKVVHSAPLWSLCADAQQPTILKPYQPLIKILGEVTQACKAAAYTYV